MGKRVRRSAREFRRKNIAAGYQSEQGLDSSLDWTLSIREFIPYVVQMLSIESIADVGAGDWNWMRAVWQEMDIKAKRGGLLDLTVDGYDTLMVQVKKNNKLFKPNFTGFDAIEEVLPRPYDLIVCRNLLVRLRLDDAEKVVDNFRASGSRYLLTNTWDNVTKNIDLTNPRARAKRWGWRPRNMLLPPFNLGPAIYLWNSEWLHSPARNIAVYDLYPSSSSSSGYGSSSSSEEPPPPVESSSSSLAEFF